MLISASASACSFPSKSIEQQVASADEVFIATLLEAKVIPGKEGHQWPWIEGRFQVGKVVKGGAQPEELILSTGMGRGDCGVSMLVSSKYIIMKGKNDTGIGIGTGTRVIEDFEENALLTKIQSIARRRNNPNRP